MARTLTRLRLEPLELRDTPASALAPPAAVTTFQTAPPVPPPVVPVVIGTPAVPGDVDGDGVADVLDVQGNTVRVLSGADGKELVARFAPFADDSSGSVS